MQDEPTAGLTEALCCLLGFGFEFGKDGSSPSEKDKKRRERLEEVVGDLAKKQDQVLPSDVLKLLGIFYLFTLDKANFISFPYEHASGWEEFKEGFYHFTEEFDDIFAFRKKKGAPTSQDAAVISLMVAVSRGVSRTQYNQKATQYWYYVWSLFVALKARVEKSEQFRKRKTRFEREEVLEKEFKAAKLALDRRWNRVYQDEPPRLEKLDKESIEAWVVGDSSQLKQFLQRLMDKLDPHQ